jgi:RNA polymerase sigma factor (sigma-70 family)
MMGPLPEREMDATSAEPFRTTHWSVVLLAGRGGSPEATEALEKLCRTYWYPIYAYVRRRGYDSQQAQDLTQEFLLHLLEKNYLARADRQRGKFRSFLLAALNHFLANDQRRDRAAKRGGGRPLISLDEAAVETRYAAEAVNGLTPEKVYEQRWALTLLDQAFVRLRNESTTAGKTHQFNQLRGFLTTEAEEIDYETAAAQLEMKPGAVAVAVHRLRQRYRELLREEISQTVASAQEVEEEIHWLFTAVAP